MIFSDYFDAQTFPSLREFPAAAQDAVFCGCSFSGCVFQGEDLSSFIFEDCVFNSCNLSLVKVTGAAFKNVRFEDCKMQGIQFFDCCRTVLAMHFIKCDLRCSSFEGLPLRKTVFEDSSLQEVNFARADLAGSSFTRCDLARAEFLRTNLEKTDFSTAYNFVLDPDANRLRKAKFSIYGLPGLLEKYGLEIE